MRCEQTVLERIVRVGVVAEHAPGDGEQASTRRAHEHGERVLVAKAKPCDEFGRVDACGEDRRVGVGHEVLRHERPS